MDISSDGVVVTVVADGGLGCRRNDVHAASVPDSQIIMPPLFPLSPQKVYTAGIWCVSIWTWVSMYPDILFLTFLKFTKLPKS